MDTISKDGFACELESGADCACANAETHTLSSTNMEIIFTIFVRRGIVVWQTLFDVLDEIRSPANRTPLDCSTQRIDKA